MDPSEEEQEGYVDPGERSFNKKNSFVKYAILLGGSSFNLLSTVLFFAAIFFFFGEGDTAVRVTMVIQNSPADKAGLKKDDIIAVMDGQPIVDADKAIFSIKARPNKSIAVIVRRGDQRLPLELVPEVDGGEGRIGITWDHEVDKATLKPLGLWPALSKACDRTWDQVQTTYKMALNMFGKSITKKEIPKDVGGPVSIVGAVAATVKKGMTVEDLLHILAVLSLAIGVFNLLPIPALDGGRILVLFVRDAIDLAYMLVFWKHPDETLFSHRMEEIVHLIGICALLILLVLVTFKDVRELIFGRDQQKLPVYPSASASPSPSPAR